MAEILPNPDNMPGQVTSGYQRQKTVLFASMSGYTNLKMSGNAIVAGSVFELNGVLFRVFEDEEINGLSEISASVFFYIYAEPVEEGIAQFHARTDVPVWHIEKAGYYISDNKRALIKAIKRPDGHVEGVKMNSILTNVNSICPPNSGGTEVFNKAVRAHEGFHANPGWYRFELQSGAGSGNGSSGQSPGSSIGGGVLTGGSGGIASLKNSINGVFYHPGGIILVHIGGSGYNGSSGSNGSYSNSGGGEGNYTNPAGAGGGSGAGEETYILSGAQRFTTEGVRAGRGGGAGQLVDFVGSQQGLPISVHYGIGSPGNGSGTNGSGGLPGWARNLGDAAAGYCRLYFLGE